MVSADSNRAQIPHDSNQSHSKTPSESPYTLRHRQIRLRHLRRDSLGQLLGLPTPAEYEKKLEGRSVAPEDGAPVEMHQVSVQRLQLDVEETQALLNRAREEGT